MERLEVQIADLNIRPADPQGAVPLYYQIEENLRGLIETGRLPAGAMIPPEMELCRAYGVGRQTMRQAISSLVDDGLVERFPGRGTFVKHRDDRTSFYLDRSFTQQMVEMGYSPRSQVLGLEVGAVTEKDPEPLRKKIGAPCLRLSRLRFGDDQPISLQETIILTELCPGIQRFDFERESLYEILAREYNLRIDQIHHAVSAVAATPKTADLLKVPLAVPLLRVKTTAYLDGERVIEASSSFYRADKYEYSTTHVYCP